MTDAVFIADHARTAADVAPDETGWIYEGREWTWSQAWESVRRTAGALTADGIGHGDHIAVVDKNNPAILQLVLGASLVGAATAIVNWRLAGDELDFTINDSGAKILFVGHELLEQVDVIRDRLTTVEKIVVMGGESDEFEAWQAAGEPLDQSEQVSADDPVVIMYSSGTTGRPKGVLLTQRNLVAHTANADAGIEYGEGAKMLIAMPMFHVGGTSYAMFGIKNRVPGHIIREVEPSALAGAMMSGVTHAFLVPAVVAMLLQAGDEAMKLFSGLRGFSYGAAPMPQTILRGAQKHWPQTRFYQVYGLTEFCGVVTMLHDAEHRDLEHPERLLSAGRTIPGVEARVVDPATLQDVPAGQAGELWFRTEQATPGYHDRPEATAEIRAGDGWMRTGDIGRIDEDGYVYVEDRIKDMIITGGENVYSPEVERVLSEHPDLLEVAIIGVPDPTWGESVKAVVALRPGAEATEAEIIDWAREHMTHYKVPRTIDVVEMLPRNPSGKILKRDLRKPYWADGRQV
ncbi:long-chain-fatty-acid--CoA ligase [Aeromicrobium flavum]|uniref:Long-chain-fatty-acid--CoA ligase n=1 Tax=Aeromicrobium flavum TaxID=416568 RepID=A0A512HT24_9ACTN|nr:long-chain-fatty-acid--CoA ligase [Aeromicrobium flavum]GEO88612.1 long-chain-fatty-acid--CoA ligase [Aeromicrobium flavum]